MDFLRKIDIYGYQVGGYQQGGATYFHSNTAGGGFSMAWKALFLWFFVMNMKWVFQYEDTRF
jgi:hypothetical protein